MKKTLVIVTHDLFSILPNHRVVEIRSGRIFNDHIVSAAELKQLQDTYLAKKL
ncbi:MAG: hypothetical protein ACTSYD_09995 [Candidatus Heimdallarchaeaceae archaeon]